RGRAAPRVHPGKRAAGGQSGRLISGVRRHPDPSRGNWGLYRTSRFFVGSFADWRDAREPAECVVAASSLMPARTRAHEERKDRCEESVLFLATIRFSP